MISLKILALVAIRICTVRQCDSAKILFYIGMGSPSHKFGYLSYAEELQERGHQITFISPFPTQGAKFRDITPRMLLDVMKPHTTTRSFVAMRLNNDWWEYWTFFPKLARDSCEAILNSAEVKDIVSGQEKFDLIIADPLAPECVFGFSLISSSPVIYFGTAGIYPWTAAPFGLQSTVLFQPHRFYMYMKDVRRFKGRLIGTVFNTAFDWRRHLWLFPAVEELWSRRLGRPMPSFEDMEKNVSLMLLNTHPVVDAPVPFTSNIIMVGGVHLRPSKPLSKELEDFVSGNGEEGFIIFSLGSIVKSETLPQRYVEYFIEAFKKLPQRVIWKWEGAGVSNLPDNVLAMKWAPQQDLLAHPKCLGFVSHGGKLAMLEAIKSGVPMVIIPFFADQDLHSEVAKQRGYGLSLELADITPDNLYEAITSIVNDPKFKEAAIKMSGHLNDQPDSPVSRAVFWTEYVLRHPEGPDVRPVSADFTWYQYHYVDVWAVIVLILLTPVVTFVILLRLLLGTTRRGHVRKHKSD